MFFIFDLKEVAEDLRYVRDRYFPDFQDDDPTIAKGTRLKQQRLILELCNYRSWNAGGTEEAMPDICSLMLSGRCRKAKQNALKYSQALACICYRRTGWHHAILHKGILQCLHPILFRSGPIWLALG